MDDSARAPFHTQLWRVLDLRAGGLGFSVELLVAAARADADAGAQRVAYGEALRLLAADCTGPQAVGTQRLLVAVLRDALSSESDGAAPEGRSLPGFIVDGLIALVGDVLAGAKGSHAVEAVKPLETYVESCGGSHAGAEKAIATIREETTAAAYSSDIEG
ncbi:hypothetical protein BC834DRAFT_888477 [Gloeopeniophorella convolvens]|nr:hypothetical protein BC834DRAFT_888477 [Gloeopeniophorella convolvens]